MPLRPGYGLSVSAGPGGDSSSALKVVPMHTVSFWPSLPIHFHLKSQVVHHGLAGTTLRIPCTVGMVCLFVEGAGTVQGHAGLHLFTAPGPLPLETRAGPQVQRVFALSVRGNTALAEKG